MKTRVPIALVFAAICASACARKSEDTARAYAPPRANATAIDAGTPIDVAVMAYLSEARALHHTANVREDTKDLAGAIDAMKRLVAAKAPHPGVLVPEVEEVRADAYARLAELEAETHDIDGALAAIHEGLTHAPEGSYFRGHLREIEGVVEETHGAILADAGDALGAKKARDRAIFLLDEAVRVQAAVLADAGAAVEADR